MPWKFRERPVRKQWHEGIAVRLGLAVLLGLSLIAVPVGWQRYQRWLDLRRLERANIAFERGDLREALLHARTLVKSPTMGAAAKDLISHATEALQSREAMSWQRTRSAMETGDTDHLLGLAEAFTTNNDPQSAERVLNRVRAEDRGSARYLRLSGKASAQLGNGEAALKLYEQAIALDPDNDLQRLELAEIQLALPDPRIQALGLSAIDKLKLKQECRLPALRLLLADATRRSDLARAREVAKIIADDQTAEFKDQLALLGALNNMRPKRNDEFNALLAQLQRSSLTEPEQILELIGWMVDHDLALTALEWTAKLPGEITSTTPVAPGIAQALMRAADWRRLRAKVEGETWPGLDFLRLAFLSLALDKLGEVKGANDTWQQAIDATEQHPMKLERIAMASYSWDQKKRTEQVLWALAASDWCPRWAMDYLWQSAMSRGETARLYEVSKFRLRAQPDNVGTRNNSIALGLLVGADTAELHAAAAELHREQGKTAAIASTYAFSLLLQGKAAEAVRVMEAFPPDQLSEPSVALYFGSVLAVAGDAERAEKYLAAAESAEVLPEERRLREVSLYLSRSRVADRAEESAAGATAWKDALNAAGEQPMLLEHLARTAESWKWPTRRDASLLKLAALNQVPEWARETLWASVLKTNDSALIQRVGRMLAKSNPDDVGARANAAIVALLVGKEPESTRAQAETLYKEHASNPEVAIAYGLARLQQGRAADAVDALGKLKPDDQAQPRVALYRGVFLAAAGRVVDAEPVFKAGTEASQVPEEKTLVQLMQRAFDTQNREGAADSRGADEAWNEALNLAKGRSDWLEVLAKMAGAFASPRHLEAALWKLAAEDRCPRWALDQLWTAVQKTGTAGQRAKVAKLRAKADPRDLAAKVDSIVLALLTGEEIDAAARQAETLYKQNSTGQGVALVHALALQLQKRNDEALKILEALPPEQLKQPRAAVYYGVCLATGGQVGKATEYFRLAKGAPLLPEEFALVERTLTGQAAPPGAAP